jgi:hypothetical protein
MNDPAASSGVSHVMPDSIRHPGRSLLDSGFRRNDGKGAFPTFYEFIILRV